VQECYFSEMYMFCMHSPYYVCSLSCFKSRIWTSHFSAGMLFILSISKYCSLVHIRTYASLGCVADVIFGQWGLTEQFIRCDFSMTAFSLYNTVLVSKWALRFQRALSVRAFSFIPCFPPTRFSAIYACRFSYLWAEIAICPEIAKFVQR